MGMYTGLRGTVKVKEEIYDFMNNFINGDLELNWIDIESYTKLTTSHSFLFEHRAEFIPFGAVCYMPDEWGDNYSKFSIETGILEFCCSLKNYESEIDSFLDFLPMIADNWNLEELYEENSESTFHIQD